MNEWLVILLRSMGMFLIAFVVLRFLGKKQPSRGAPFRFLTYMVIAILSALLSVNIIRNFAFGLVAIGVWAVFYISLEYLSIKSKWVHDLFHGKETVLVKQGKIMEESLLQLRMTGEELLRELRNKNAFSLADVEFALMETTGDINVLLKSDKLPMTPYDMGTPVAPRSEPQTIIMDGNIMDEPLAGLGLNREWLQIQLESLGISLKNVFIGQVDSSGELYVDLHDDAVHLAQPKVNELIYANLEKVQADLTTYALETQDEAAKAMYTKNSEALERLMEKLKPYLLR